MPNMRKINVNDLKNFVQNCFIKSGVSREDAEITTNVLVESDQRGISSHGVARLQRYIDGIKNGVMIPDADFEIVKETPNTLLVSGNDGLGQPVSYKVMKLVIEKAKKNNIAIAAIRNSNHYGIAGYYSLMALQENLIGLSMTNSFPLVVPTFGKNALFGTNPISISAPSDKEIPFVLDMATSTVPRGKLEVYERQNKELPDSWATDSQGHPTHDPALVLNNLKNKLGGGLIPLGGAKEETSGYKGYGMGMIVEVLTGILSGGAFGPFVYGKKGEPANVCHFLGAVNIEAFISLNEFTTALDSMINILHNSEKADGENRIYIHGEKEHYLKLQQLEEVNITETVITNIKEVGKSLGVEAQFLIEPV
jgi:LDH2 family malate/lactate/ureidoglycolate dehydrogenase